MNMCLGENMKTIYIHVWYKKWWLKAIVNPYENDMNHDTCHVRLTLSVLLCISFGLYQSHPLRFNHQNTSIYRIIIPKGLTVLITYVHHYTHYTCLLVIFLSLHKTNKNPEASVRLQRLSIQGSCERKGFFSLLIFSFLSFLSNFNEISQCCAWFQLNSLFTDNRDTTLLSVQQFSRRINFACIRKRTQSSKADREI